MRSLSADSNRLKKFGATRRSRTGDLLITNPADTVTSTEHHHIYQAFRPPAISFHPS